MTPAVLTLVFIYEKTGVLQYLSVFVLMLSTSILGPVMTERYTPLMMRSWRRTDSERAA